MRPRSFALAVTFAATMVFIPACGDDTASDGDTGSANTTTTTTASSTPTISGVWARNSPMAAGNGAAYMVVTGGTGDDAIVAASVDASVAGKVELHETVAADSDSSDAAMSSTTGAAGGAMSSTTLAPAMEMRAVTSIDVPAGEKVELKPGGYHVMLLDLVQPLVVGDSFDMTVTFATAGEQQVVVEVKEAP